MAFTGVSNHCIDVNVVFIQTSRLNPQAENVFLITGGLFERYIPPILDEQLVHKVFWILFKCERDFN